MRLARQHPPPQSRATWYDPPVAREFKKAESSSWSSYDWLDEIERLRAAKPRPIRKLFGEAGPTADQLADYRAEERSWNAAHRHARSRYAKALAAEEREPPEVRAAILERHLSRPRTSRIARII